MCGVSVLLWIVVLWFADRFPFDRSLVPADLDDNAPVPWVGLVGPAPVFEIVLGAFGVWAVWLARGRPPTDCGSGLVLASYGTHCRGIGVMARQFTGYGADPAHASIGTYLLYAGDAAFILGMLIFVVATWRCWRAVDRRAGVRGLDVLEAPIR